MMMIFLMNRIRLEKHKKETQRQNGEEILEWLNKRQMKLIHRYHM